MYAFELAGEDDTFAAIEAGSAATDVTVVGPGVATATAIDADRVRGLAYTHRVGELVARTDADVAAARAAVESAPVSRTGTVAVRARDCRDTAGIDTQSAERVLGTALVERGFAVDLDDPDHELRAVFADDRCLLSWLAVETERSYGERAPTDKPFFQPGSMDPMLARAIVNIAGARPGATLLDPMCGTGGVLVEGGLVGARALGTDAQRKMVAGATENLSRYLPRDQFHVARSDATRLPLPDDSVEGVVFDAPYGRQSKIEAADLRSLVSGALAEARRVAPRAVVVADRRWNDVAEDAGWTVEATAERRVHRSLTRYVLVLRGE